MISLLPTWYVTTLAAVFGAIFGSFLNVVIYRVPNGGTLMGRSYCPRCDHLIRGYHNIPILSWLLLRGKCHDCKAPISPRYILIETFTAVAWAGITLAFWPTQPWLVPLLLFFMAMSIALAMIDFDTMRLPNVLVYPTILVTAAYLTVYAAFTGQWNSLATAGLGALALTGFYFLLHVGTKGRGLGFGDVKLAIALGLLLGWFGWGALIVGTFAAFVVGGIPAAILLATGIVKKGTPIPFGPMLLLGAWIGVLWGPQLSTLYLSLTGLS